MRPISAIRHLHGDRPVRAWGGPGRGTIDDLPASQWTSYIQTADHPEYPSGSASFCAAHAQASRRFLGSDSLGWMVPTPQGSSRIEPGITPARDISIGWATWTDYRVKTSPLGAAAGYPGALRRAGAPPGVVVFKSA